MNALRNFALNLRTRQQAFENACEAGDIRAALAAWRWLLVAAPAIALAMAACYVVTLAAYCFSH